MVPSLGPAQRTQKVRARLGNHGCVSSPFVENWRSPRANKFTLAFVCVFPLALGDNFQLTCGDIAMRCVVRVKGARFASARGLLEIRRIMYEANAAVGKIAHTLEQLCASVQTPPKKRRAKLLDGLRVHAIPTHCDLHSAESATDIMRSSLGRGGRAYDVLGITGTRNAL